MPELNALVLGFLTFLKDYHLLFFDLNTFYIGAVGTAALGGLSGIAIQQAGKDSDALLKETSAIVDLLDKKVQEDSKGEIDTLLRTVRAGYLDSKTTRYIKFGYHCQCVFRVVTYALIGLFLNWQGKLIAFGGPDVAANVFHKFACLAVTFGQIILIFLIAHALISLLRLRRGLRESYEFIHSTWGKVFSLFGSANVHKILTSMQDCGNEIRKQESENK